jgi:hypothetical protein
MSWRQSSRRVRDEVATWHLPLPSVMKGLSAKSRVQLLAEYILYTLSCVVCLPSVAK